MSIADSIIGGTYGNSGSVANNIIDGSYSEKTFKKRKQEIKLYSAKQQALQKQKRKEEEEKAWNNLKALENSYQEKEKWLLANQNQNNTVLGTVTDEYKQKQEEMQQANEAYKNALSNYYNEYKEEYDQRLKESNQKSKEQLSETIKRKWNFKE